MFKKCNIRRFGYISKISSLANTFLQATVKGTRRRGRQKKRLEDNVIEWIGMDFVSTTTAAEDRTRWKGIVIKSPVVPQ